MTNSDQNLEIELLPDPKPYEKLFQEISKLDPDDIVYRVGCKFCEHPARADAEEVFERTRSYTPVFKFFRDFKAKHPQSCPMSVQNIRNHCLNHYNLQEQKIWMREYSQKISLFMNNKIDTEKRLNAIKSIMEEKLLSIASNPMIDEVKAADIIIKLAKQIVEIDISQAKLKGELKSVNIVIDKFMNVWSHLAQEYKTPEAKQIIMDGLAMFEEHLTGVNLIEQGE
jgi:RNA recognition motif-containing protein